MKKNLVVGGSGFLGLNWLEYLQQNGSTEEVIVFAHEKPEGVKFPSFVTFVVGDYADAKALDDLFSKHSFNRNPPSHGLSQRHHLVPLEANGYFHPILSE